VTSSWDGARGLDGESRPPSDELVGSPAARPNRGSFGRIEAASRELHDALERIALAAQRMGELGVSKAGVEAFGGAGEDGEDGRW
jgi:hypothetical protein